eukprot:TRINITY_DN1823_c0_g2_i1.p1 TRINITY_DN1823_c0_g2~~TRINITY_DN1823_c0_g2_i1.p1  ORF type:complete len:331 (+),score=109.57 TRINITY_DN1823_c0_g2_i1:64-1056(+)
MQGGMTAAAAFVQPSGLAQPAVPLPAAARLSRVPQLDIAATPLLSEGAAASSSEGIGFASSAAAAVVLVGLAAATSASRQRQRRVPRTARAAFGTAAVQRRSSGLLLQRAAEPEIDPRPPGKDSPSVPPVRMPMIDTGKGSIDVMSRLLQDRVLMLNGQVNDEMANVLIAQMLYLANKDPEKDITVYINSPGGSVSAGLAMYDSMQFVPCDVSTVCYGMAASMGAFLLGAGTKGKRKCLPNARVMIHQPLGGAGGQAADIEIQAKEILFLKDLLNTYMSDFTGKGVDQIALDTDRDNFMTPEEAVEYGLIDEVIPTKSWPRLQKPPKPPL